ncbi:MAG: acyl carrier protein [Chloroflexi bacterium]|nr:MAG: acyl carrier protein [Chloroflexota bacterium]
MENSQIKIKGFLSRTFRNYDLQDDEDIFALGFVTSLFAMELVLFVEKSFNIAIGNEDLEIENFRTIRAITGLVERKTRSPIISEQLGDSHAHRTH